MKKIILIITILLIFINYSNATPPRLSLSDCENPPKGIFLQKTIDECYYHASIYEKNIESCKKISNQTLATECKEIIEKLKKGDVKEKTYLILLPIIIIVIFILIFYIIRKRLK